MLACLASENWIGLPEGLPDVGRYFEVSLEDGRIVLTPLDLGDSEQAREWTAELLRMAQAWLERADREFDSERDLVASRYLWEAVRAAITAVGVKRGIPVDNDDEMFDFVRRLDKECCLHHVLLTEFGMAQLFKRNTEEIDNYGDSQWDSSDFDTGRPAVKRLIERLASMVSA